MERVRSAIGLPSKFMEGYVIHEKKTYRYIEFCISFNHQVGVRLTVYRNDSEWDNPKCPLNGVARRVGGGVRGVRTNPLWRSIMED